MATAKNPKKRRLQEAPGVTDTPPFFVIPTPVLVQALETLGQLPAMQVSALFEQLRSCQTLEAHISATTDANGPAE